MTEKTNADINTSLARSKGWTFTKGNIYRRCEQGYKEGIVNYFWEWQNPLTGDWQEHPPDFCGDWKHTGPLLEELYKKYGWVKTSDLIGRHLDHLCGEHGLDPMVYEDDREKIVELLIEAIARAREAMIKEGG